MLKQATSRKQLLPFLLSLAFVISSITAVGTAKPTSQPIPAAFDPQIADCSKATDTDIVKAVVENINKRFSPEQVKSELHFTITSKDGVVSISGDAHGINRKDPRQVRTTVTTIAQKTSCVKKVVTKHFTQDHPIKCLKTQKQCNGGCIDQNEECNPLSR
jgi:hypothetical protein